jgi:hypothetical protein
LHSEQQQQQVKLPGRAAWQRRRAGRSRSPTPPRRKLQPLLPAACAMALLPRGGRMHAGEHPALACRSLNMPYMQLWLVECGNAAVRVQPA